MQEIIIKSKANVLDLLLKSNGFNFRFNIIPDGKKFSKLMVTNVTSREIARIMDIMDLSGIPCTLKATRGSAQVNFMNSSLYQNVSGMP